jgi:CheY-like chemotaxis protein
MRHAGYIMIIEDVADERDAARLTLEIEGYVVRAFASGDEALDYLHSADVLPCMILLDLMMHGKNGWEFRTEQRQDTRLAAIPVIVCSGDGRLSEKAEALGVITHLTKPIDQKAFLAAVARHCPNN